MKKTLFKVILPIVLLAGFGLQLQASNPCKMTCKFKYYRDQKNRDACYKKCESGTQEIKPGKQRKPARPFRPGYRPGTYIPGKRRKKQRKPSGAMA